MQMQCPIQSRMMRKEVKSSRSVGRNLILQNAKNLTQIRLPEWNYRKIEMEFRKKNLTIKSDNVFDLPFPLLFFFLSNSFSEIHIIWILINIKCDKKLWIRWTGW